MQKRFSSNSCSCEAKVNPMTPLHHYGSLSIAQRHCCIDMPRLCLHIRYRRARV